MKTIFSQLTLSGVENNAQPHYSFIDSIGLGCNQKHEMCQQEHGFSYSEVTDQSVSWEIKLATAPIIRHVEKLSVCNDLDTSGNNDTTGFQCDDTPTSSSYNLFDCCFLLRQVNMYSLKIK